MFELTKEAYEADTHQPLTASEIDALPRRKTWYGVAGSADETLDPQYVSSSADYARQKAATLNHECPLSGPWYVVTLTENLRTPV